MLINLKDTSPEVWISGLFDIYKDMVIIKGKNGLDDITNKLVHFQNLAERNMYEIKYYGNGIKYTPGASNIIMGEKPKRLDIKNEKIYCDEKVLINVQCLLQFNCRIGSVTRIIYKDRKCHTVYSDRLKILENDPEHQSVSQMLDYVEDIIQNDIKHDRNKNEDKINIKKDLAAQVNKIRFIHADSVLYSYLLHNPIKVRQIDLNNIIYPFNFNLSQKAALENALTHSISVIQGPPGTGKTQTILNILANLVAVQHKSVAVVSNNNEAVKNVQEKMEAAGYGFLTALLGSKGENQKEFFSNMPEVPSLQDWNCTQDINALYRGNNRLGKKLNGLLKVYRDKKKKEQELRDWQTEQKHFEEYYSKKVNRSEEIQLPEVFQTADIILSFLAENAVVWEGKMLYKLLYRFKLKFKYKMKGTERPDWKTLITLQRKFYILQIKEIVNEISMMEYQLAQNSFDDLLKEYQKVSAVLFRNYLYLSHNNLGKADFTIEDYKKRYEEFIKRYPIILSSTQSIRKSLPYNSKAASADEYLLDYVIIDESSQVDLIRGMLAFSCCKNVIIVGDEKQLPQIVNKDLEKWLKTEPIGSEYNYFTENIMSSMRLLYGEELPCTTLLEHYRCHPKIIGFCNQRYYDGKLIPCTNADTTVEPLILYKTPEGNHMRNKNTGEKQGRYNQRELDVIKKEILKNLNIDDNEKVGIVTPFRLQADKASEELNDAILCDTVHKYQGKEREIMIMTTVLDNKEDSWRMINFVDDPNMVNVAVSRAQKQFILDTDHDLFLHKGKEIGALMRYIQYNTPEKYIMESQVISVFDLLYKRFSDKLLPLKKKMNPKAEYKSEEAVRVLLEEIFKQEEYNLYGYNDQVYLSELLHDYRGEWKKDGLLTKEEFDFVKNRSSVDFLIHDKMDKTCILVIEVDGFSSHENKPKHLKHDKLKNSILEKYKIPLLRLKTNGSGEREKIENALDVIRRSEQLAWEELK